MASSQINPHCSVLLIDDYQFTNESGSECERINGSRKRWRRIGKEAEKMKGKKDEEWGKREHWGKCTGSERGGGNKICRKEEIENLRPKQSSLHWGPQITPEKTELPPLCRLQFQ